jgi:hypothetical protein
MDPAQLDPNGDGGGRVVGSNARRVDDTWVKPTPSPDSSRQSIFECVMARLTDAS